MRVWQALCLLSPLVPAEQALRGDFAALLGALACAEPTNIKQYQETCALMLLRASPGLLRAALLPPLRDYRSGGGHALPSLVLVAARAAASAAAVEEAGTGAGLAREERQQQQQEQLLEEVADALTPWSLSHVHAHRTFAQLVLCRLFDRFPRLVAAGGPTAASLHRFFRCASVWEEGRTGTPLHVQDLGETAGAMIPCC